MRLDAYLDGLKRELAALERAGIARVDEVKAEIRRVEALLGLDVATPVVERAVASAAPEQAVSPAARPSRPAKRS